jgi:hypothetical protein
MENSKKKIINKLHEANDKAAMQTAFNDRLKDAEDVVKTSLGSDMDPEEVKSIAAKLATESVETDGFNPVVQYHSDRRDETPFMINGTKWQYVNGIYPDGKKDIAVYRYGHDLAYDYKWFMDNVVGRLKNNNQQSMGEGEHDSVGRGIEAGMNPEVEADKYEEYRQLMAQLAAEEGGEEQVKEESALTEGTSDYNLTNSENVSNMMRDIISIIAKYVGTQSTNNGAVANDNRVILYNMVNSGKFMEAIQQMLPPSNMHLGSSGREYLTNNEKEMVSFLNSIGMDTSGLTFRSVSVRESLVKEGSEVTNDPVKLKADVQKLMSKLDMSSIAPYLEKIDNPTEQAEVIAQFAEKIGVPKTKLSSVISNLRTVAENVTPKMTKNKLIETITGRKIIKTIKVKDIK